MLLTFGLLAALAAPALAQTEDAIIEATRRVLKADRQALLAEEMQFTEAEAEAFWPVYHQYRTEMDKVGDGIKKLVLNYARLYPNIPDDRAKGMLKELAGLEKQQVATRARYLKKAGKLLPASKALRFAQVESRLDLAVRAELAANIPLVPIEGRLSAEAGSAEVFAEGAPGGIVVQTLDLTAKVAAIDKPARKVTLIDENGIKQTVKAGPEVINFDQIREGNTLRLMVTEELVVQMAGVGVPSSDGEAAVVALAPKGAKPGGVLAATQQVTGTVTALDPVKRTATLTFEDGSSRIFPVRRDVDLAKRKVGDKVRFRLTEMVALKVERR